MAKDKEVVWLIMWNTESGDEGIDGVFKKKPTQKQLDDYMKDNYRAEFEEGYPTIYYHLEDFEVRKTL